MDKKCRGCIHQSKSMYDNIEWCFCLNQDIVEDFNKEDRFEHANKYFEEKNKNNKFIYKSELVPSCMYAQTYYCDMKYYKT